MIAADTRGVDGRIGPSKDPGEAATSHCTQTPRMTGTVTWIPLADAAHMARVPAKTVYRWALNGQVRRIVTQGRVLVVFEDVTARRSRRKDA